MEIETIYQNVQVNEFCVKHEGDLYSVYFEFTSTQGNLKVKLGGVSDTDDLCDLLHAQKLWMKEETDSQKEFGRFTLGMQNETYSEVIFEVLS